MSNFVTGLSVAVSEKFPPGTREAHDDFCLVEKWQLVRGASGKPVKHHRTYELSLWDGRILRTRISHPVNKTEYGPRVWTHILKTQLEVDGPTFWACVTHKQLPNRGQPIVRSEAKSIPLFLLRELMQLGVTETEALQLSPRQAHDLREKLMLSQ
jgi:hypothetical protein